MSRKLSGVYKDLSNRGRLRSLTHSKGSSLQGASSRFLLKSNKHPIQSKQDEYRKMQSKIIIHKDSGRSSVNLNSSDREMMGFLKYNKSALEPSTYKKKLLN